MTTTILPSYTVYISTNSTFMFKPVAIADIGTKIFDITLNDGCAQVKYRITINVLNSPPVYNTTVPSN